MQRSIFFVAAHFRNPRHTILGPFPPTVLRKNSEEMLSEGSACLTSRGVLGVCSSFRACYPYFKIPNLDIWESWVLGNYDTCTVGFSI